MLHVTWEWLGREAALDVANTVAVSNGVEHDLLRPSGEYERWAAAAAESPELEPDQADALIAVRARLLELREHIRHVLAATAAGEPPPNASVAELNRVSRECPAWLELDPSGELRQHARGRAPDLLLATYARSAMEIAAEGASRLRVCPAPSCGMFYRPNRERQRWCSQQCGTRARVAHHYARTAKRPAVRANSDDGGGSIISS
jgi:predicted RNA-binding Zn ribbon-like protein